MILWNLMMINKLYLYLAVCLFFVFSSNAEESYQPNWNSLANHNEAPEWFRNAKFGIYFHWGPYSVPAFGNEHYPRTMYGHPSGKKPVENKLKKNYTAALGFQSFREHEFHISKYGNLNDFEYHDLIPLFKAEKFDAYEWAALFKKAGARFAGPVAEHHDGYSMWNSSCNPWNAYNTGPKRDIVGEMEEAVRHHGMKFITTFHHARSGRYPNGSDEKEKRKWYYYGREKYFERNHFQKADNQELQKMYGTFSWSDFLNMWNVKLEEVIYNYSPDLIWFDTWLDRIPQTNRQQFAATYLNSSKDNNQEVVITYKQNDLPQNVGVVDYEKGRLDKLTTFTWLTDDTISAGPWTTTGSWSFTHELDIKSSKELIHTLIDIVSKNGNLLLNISPRADGSIPIEQKDSLLGLGSWLEVNGEAIYNTRPFKRFGEGPKRMASSGHFIEMKSDYNHENIRFTTNNDIIYAIQMGWTGDNKYTLIKSLSDSSLGKTVIKSINVLGTDEVIDWKITSDGLMVKTPIVSPNDYAIVFRIVTDGWNNINIKDEAVPMAKISVDG